MQDLVNQPLYIKQVYAGFAQPDYGPVVNGSSDLDNPSVEPNAYPYNPAKAAQLLTSHGWAVKPGGTTTCASPGTGPTQCGAGVEAGAPLNLNLLIYSGQEQQQQQMTAYKTAAATVGINISLQTNVNVFAAAPACTASQASCSWQIADWGGGIYTPPNGYPVEAGYFDCNGNNNHENYCDPQQDKLDNAAASDGTAASTAAWEKFVSLQLPISGTRTRTSRSSRRSRTSPVRLPANTTLSVFPEAGTSPSEPDGARFGSPELRLRRPGPAVARLCQQVERVRRGAGAVHGELRRRALRRADRAVSLAEARGRRGRATHSPGSRFPPTSRAAIQVGSTRPYRAPTASWTGSATPAVRARP